MQYTTRRGAPRPRELARVLTLVPDPLVASWVEAELRGEDVVLRTARTADEVVTALVDDPPPRAQGLVVDADGLGALDVFRLHAIREGGWFGVVVALGEVAPALRRSLNIAHVVPRWVAHGALRDAIADIGASRATARMITLARTRPR